jgi:hypothetical protein
MLFDIFDFDVVELLTKVKRPSWMSHGQLKAYQRSTG